LARIPSGAGAPRVGAIIDENSAERKSVAQIRCPPLSGQLVTVNAAPAGGTPAFVLLLFVNLVIAAAVAVHRYDGVVFHEHHGPFQPGNVISAQVIRVDIAVAKDVKDGAGAADLSAIHQHVADLIEAHVALRAT
jgi:hypothetical protein